MLSLPDSTHGKPFDTQESFFTRDITDNLRQESVSLTTSLEEIVRIIHAFSSEKTVTIFVNQCETISGLKTGNQTANGLIIRYAFDTSCSAKASEQNLQGRNLVTGDGP
jgi:hypothetical protein